MFNLRVAEYIKTNMHRHAMTFERLKEVSGVPLSTLNAYANAKVAKHTEDTLLRIAAAFGDPPTVIEDMRKMSAESYEQEKRLIAESKDAEQMAKLSALIRSNVAQILEEYRTQALAQQVETSRHADERVRIAEQKAADAIAAAEQKAAEQVERIRKDSAAAEQVFRTHGAELMDIERRGFAEAHTIEKNNIAYLRTLVRNLTISLVAVGLIAVCLCIYVFAH